MAAEALEGPDVLRFHMAEEIAVACLSQDAEEGFAGEYQRSSICSMGRRLSPSLRRRGDSSAL